MIRALEKPAKKSLAFVFRFIFRSTPVSIPPSEKIQRILVIRQHNQLGDMLCVVPLLRALRTKFPLAFIALLASPINVAIVQHNRYLDEVINFDKRELLKGGMLRMAAVSAFLKGLRKRHFDVVLIPSTVSLSFTSHLVAYLSSAPIRIGAGSIDGEENQFRYLVNHTIDLDWRETPHLHQTLRNLEFGKPLLAGTDDLSMDIALTALEVDQGKHIYQQALTGHSLSIGFHPGAGKLPNCWPPDRFAAVANALWREEKTLAFITSGHFDAVAVKGMIKRLEGPYYLLENLSVRTVASVLSNLRLVISNDTGIMHVAAAVGVPVLSLFGPTDPKQWAPIGPEHRYIVSRDGNISSISVDEVLKVAREMLQK